MEIKEPKTYDEQLAILQSRGIIVLDQERCKQILSSVNYYRLSAYFLPFKLKNGAYKSGTSFLRAYRIYEFDRKLRNIVFAAIEEIEIFLRARFAYFHAHKYGATGYLNSANFSPNHNHKKFMVQINREIENNKNTLIVKHHKAVYEGIFPIWAITELLTFGILSKFYADLTTSDQKELARSLYQTSNKNLKSWLRCCTDLRNICAHYGRLYYRIFAANPAGLNISDREKTRLWGAILVLKSLFPDKVKWNTEILSALSALVEEYSTDINLYHIAFPDDWSNQLMK